MFIFEFLPLCIVDEYSAEEDGRLFRHDVLTNTYTSTVFKRSPFSDAMSVSIRLRFVVRVFIISLYHQSGNSNLGFEFS